jgi:hypothetical protein
MAILNLPEYDLQLKWEGESRYVFDPYRKKYVLLTPEEEVRQRFAGYLIHDLEYPASLIQTEESLRLNDMIRRADILVHKPAGNPVVLVECKAPSVRPARSTFDQAARYNLVFRVPFLIVTNGMKHYCCRVDFEKQKVEFMDHIPTYGEI